MDVQKEPIENQELQPVEPGAEPTNEPEQAQEATPDEKFPAKTDSAAEPGEDPQEKLIRAEVRVAAALAGIDEKLHPRVLQMVDLTAARAAGADISTAVKTAVDEVLSDLPSLKKDGVDTGSLGNYRRTRAADAESTARETFANALKG